jgi:hypothetical protein
MSRMYRNHTGTRIEVRGFLRRDDSAKPPRKAIVWPAEVIDLDCLIEPGGVVHDPAVHGVITGLTELTADEAKAFLAEPAGDTPPEPETAVKRSTKAAKETAR